MTKGGGRVSQKMTKDDGGGVIQKMTKDDGGLRNLVRSKNFFLSISHFETPMRIPYIQSHVSKKTGPNKFLAIKAKNSSSRIYFKDSVSAL